MPEPFASDTLTIRYHFTFRDGQTKSFSLQLDKKTLALIRAPGTARPASPLDACPCPRCPRYGKADSSCPATASVSELVDLFGRFISHEPAQVRIETDERTYVRQASLQQAVSSLIGIYMAASGCPVMAKLRPMVRFHLPFATLEETTYRVLSMYLFAQYLVAKQGGTPDWTLEQLKQIYEDIRVVNESFCKRLMAMNIEDTSVNAVVILDTFASMVSFSIDEQMLDDLQQLFQPYLERREPTP